LEALQKLAKI